MTRLFAWVRELAQWTVAVAAWAQLNKLAIGGVTSGVLAVVRAVADGADTTTLVLAVASVAGVLSHLTVTPLARPRAADGTPLVPATPALTLHLHGKPGSRFEGVTVQRLPETPGAGRLGRHVEHDPRSLNYLVPESSSTLPKVRWVRRAPIFNQGELRSCTGNAMAGALGTDSRGRRGDHTVRESTAVALYEHATLLDSIPGAYPPDDTGSSGLAAAKAAQRAGLIAGYQHATTLTALLTALQSGPVIVGTAWRTGMDTPDPTGLVHAEGDVRGGHEYELIGYDPQTGLLEAVNSWGRGWGRYGHFFLTTSDMAALLADSGDCTVPVFHQG